MPDPANSAWLPAVERWAGGPVTVVAREPLAGGYAAAAVQRVDLEVGGRALAVVVKRVAPAEVAAMRALAVVRELPRPRLLAAGPDWLVLPYYPGEPATDGPEVPVQVWDALARVHAHWWRKRPRGLPVVDAEFWRALCDRTLVALRGAEARAPGAGLDEAVRAVARWRGDERMLGAVASLPRTLVHGDPHRGNILLAAGTATLIDWGGARVAPAALDLAVLRAQGAVDLTPYRVRFAELTGGGPPPELLAVEEHWADVYAHVQYLGFAADHLGPERVRDMVAVAARAHVALDVALRR